MPLARLRPTLVEPDKPRGKLFGLMKKHQAAADTAFLEAASKSSMLNDLVNTGVMATVIGGFALSNLQAYPEAPRPIDTLIYLLNVVAVHACTCSSLASALLYTNVNNLVDAKFALWAHTFPWNVLLLMPTPKFVAGCAFYLLGVLALSWRDLRGSPTWRYVALGVGVGSVAMVVTTATIVACAMAGPRQKAGNEGLAAALRGDAEAPSESGGGRAPGRASDSIFGVAVKHQRKVGAAEERKDVGDEQA